MRRWFCVGEAPVADTWHWSAWGSRCEHLRDSEPRIEPQVVVFVDEGGCEDMGWASRCCQNGCRHVPIVVGGQHLEQSASASGVGCRRGSHLGGDVAGESVQGLASASRVGCRRGSHLGVGVGHECFQHIGWAARVAGQATPDRLRFRCQRSQIVSRTGRVRCGCGGDGLVAAEQGTPQLHPAVRVRSDLQQRCATPRDHEFAQRGVVRGGVRCGGGDRRDVPRRRDLNKRPVRAMFAGGERCPCVVVGAVNDRGDGVWGSVGMGCCHGSYLGVCVGRRDLRHQLRSARRVGDDRLTHFWCWMLGETLQKLRSARRVGAMKCVRSGSLSR